MAWIGLTPYKQQTLLYSVYLYSNPYSNAGEHQRKYTTHYGQNRAISSTGRTRVNTCEQGVSSPPFGSSEYLLRTPPYLKQGYKELEML
jgi:hypothetical protein